MTGTKLTWDDVRAIRALFTAGQPSTTTRAVAAAYGVSQAAVSKIIQNRSWRDPEYIPVSIGYRGEANGRAKLDWATVRRIRQQYTAREASGYALARQHRMASSTISGILTNALWHDPEYMPPPPRRKKKDQP